MPLKMIIPCGGAAAAAAAAAANGIRKFSAFGVLFSFINVLRRSACCVRWPVDHHWLAELGTLFVSVEENGMLWKRSGMSCWSICRSWKDRRRFCKRRCRWRLGSWDQYVCKDLVVLPCLWHIHMLFVLLIEHVAANRLTG